MKIFLAGGTGAVGKRLIPALIKACHQVLASTQSRDKSQSLRAAGAQPVVFDDLGIRVRQVTVNGAPGVMVFDDRDHAISVLSLDVHEGEIHAIRTVINPDKLAHLGRVSELTRLSRRSESD